MARLLNIHLRNFRNFTDFSCDFNGDSAVLTGKNGSGKTSVLESVFFMSKLRSFRTSRTVELCRIGESFFSVGLNYQTDNGWNECLTVSDGEKRSLLVDDNPITKTSSFAGRFETVAFLPDDPMIVTGAPVYRRKFIDMLICSMDRSYFRMLQEYRQALENYNAVLELRPARRDAARPFAYVLAQKGSAILCRRIEYFAKIQAAAARILNEMRPELADFSIVSRHDPELENPETYLCRLEKSFERDSVHGKTYAGPHYTDFDMIAAENQLRHFGSRGQCRIVSLALKLTELEFMNRDPSKKIVILIDDALADLDEKLRETFLESISGSCQKIFAFPELPDHDFFKNIREIKL